MARKSQHTFSKREREQKKAQKAAQKQARRDERKDPPAPGSATAPDDPAREQDDAASSG